MGMASQDKMMITRSMTKMMHEVDDVDAPNIFPYKKCSECGERRSCGSYEDKSWFCEDCYHTIDNCEEDDCEKCCRGIYCNCGDDRCPHCNSTETIVCGECKEEISDEDNVGCCNNEKGCPKNIDSMCNSCATWVEKDEAWYCVTCRN